MTMQIMQSAEPPGTEAARLDRLAARLQSSFESAGSAVVALSGGVDSALVAVLAGRALGGLALSVTGVSPSYPEVQRRMVESVVQQFSLVHEWIDTDEMNDHRYVRNAPNRCYFCKSELYSRLSVIARERGFACVLDGTNYDDLGDDRPGRIAAQEIEVRSPLLELGVGKRDVRALARINGIPVWDAPASACLASRIPHGTPVTIARLGRVERAEAALRGLGFRQVRVRHHESLARIEIPLDELSATEDEVLVRAIIEAVTAAGFDEAEIDPRGYRSRE